MPDDRELESTGRGADLLDNEFAGMASVSEMALAMAPSPHDEDAVLKKPMGLLFWLAVGFVSLVVLAAVLANFLHLPSDTFQDYNALNAGPSSQHLLGTDDLGRDLLSRLIFGARVSLIVGVGATLIGLIFGGTAGLIAGYKGGAVDSVMNAASFVVLAFPAIVAVIAILAFWGVALWKITVIIGVATIPLMFRVVRATCLAFANRDFVIAAQTMGAGTTRILLREILPNVIPVATTFALISMAGVIVLEGTLAFLGLSVKLPTPSWGNMINEGTSNGLLGTNPYIMLWPALAMFLLLLSINLIGDRLRQKFDVREGLI